MCWNYLEEFVFWVYVYDCEAKTRLDRSACIFIQQLIKNNWYHLQLIMDQNSIHGLLGGLAVTFLSRPTRISLLSENLIM